MKIHRPGKDIVIGKRVTFGAIVGAFVSAGIQFYNFANPDNPVPAGVAVSLTTLFTGIGQVIIVNRFGVTQ